MPQKSLVVFIDDHKDDTLSIIDSIFSHFKSEYHDFSIVCDDNTNIPEKYSTIPSIFLRFFRGDVVFLSLDAFLENENILANNIFLMTSIDELLSSKINRARIKSAKILSIDNTKIEVIDHATI